MRSPLTTAARTQGCSMHCAARTTRAPPLYHRKRAQLLSASDRSTGRWSGLLWTWASPTGLEPAIRVSQRPRLDAEVRLVTLATDRVARDMFVAANHKGTFRHLAPGMYALR